MTFREVAYLYKIIDRAEFDGNPKKYFQDLRKK
jgi:hypothetical protein